MRLPIFNFEPLDRIWVFAEETNNQQLKALMLALRGNDNCCEGNPCYLEGCLACFCRGNIRYLTENQAQTQDTRKKKSISARLA